MKRIYLLLLIPLIWSCSSTKPYLDTSTMGSLNKGETYQNLILSNEINVKVHSEWELENQKNTSKYKAVVFEYFVREVNYVPKNFPLIVLPFGTLKDISYNVLVFKDDNLFFWGFVEDFLRYDDNEINSIGEEVSEILTKIEIGE